MRPGKRGQRKRRTLTLPCCERQESASPRWASTTKAYSGIHDWNQSMSNPIALWNGIIAMVIIGMLLFMLLLKNEFRFKFEGTRKLLYLVMFMSMLMV
jgi:hypothetical protein